MHTTKHIKEFLTKMIMNKKMKNIYLIAFTVFLTWTLQACKEHTQTLGKISINSDWKYKILESATSEEDFNSLCFDDSSWETVSLPHTAHIEPLIVNNQWQGICWYRKTFSVPDVADGKKVILELEAAMNHSKIWVNGELVTTHQGGYLPVVVDVTKYVKKGKGNVLAVRLNNTDNPITGPKPLAKLDFNMYGGLYRNAWLIIKDNIYISHPVLANKVAGGGVFVTFPKVSEAESVIHIKTNVINEDKEAKTIKVVNSIFYKDVLIEKSESSSSTIQTGKDLDVVADISIENAQLWSPKNPNLYRLETVVLIDNNVIDKEVNKIGIREFTFKNNDLYINGEKTFLRGVNRHQEYPFVGYALSDNAQYRDAKKIKDGGFDYIRLSHYPQSPAFLDACDELGLVVIDAILGWQYYLDNDLFREYCYRSATELIRRDRNHPCVMAWEVSLNETQMPIFSWKN